MLEGFFAVGVIAFCLAGIAVVGHAGIMAVRTGVIIVNDISMRFRQSPLMYLVGMGIAVFLEYALGRALVELVLWYTHHW